MKFAVVSPVYNEENCLPEFLKRILQTFDDLAGLGHEGKLIIVDDGSNDNSRQLLQNAAESDMRIATIHLAINAGHQNAVWCGLESVPTGLPVIVMDCDLQDPPELIGDMLLASTGVEIVFTKRVSRKDTFTKTLMAKYYYRILSGLADGVVVKDSGDFYYLSNTALESLLFHKERVKYIRGLIASLGYRTFTLEYSRDERFAGETHYTFSKMLKLAIAGITGFSISPLIYISYIAVTSAIFTLVGALATLFLKIFSPQAFSPGIAAILMILLTLGSLILGSLAILSIYIARITLETKNRPLYIVESSRNLDK